MSEDKKLSEVMEELHSRMPLDTAKKVFNNEGLSVASPTFPGMGAREEPSRGVSSLFKDVMEGSEIVAEDTHGFPLNPLTLLEEQLNVMEEADSVEEVFWDQFKPEDPVGPEIVDAENAEDADTPVDEQTQAEEVITDSAELTLIEDTCGVTGSADTERPLQYDELVSPLSIEQIRKQRAAGKNVDGTPRKKDISYRTVLKLFVIGKSTSKEDDYPYEADLAAYESLHDDVVNCKAILALEKIEGIAGTCNFKVLLKVLYAETTI